MGLVQGTLDLLVLLSLRAEPRHGYGVMRFLRETSEDALQIEEGALYPALHRLEARGWIKGRWVEKTGVRRRCYYTLTTEGHESLARQRQEWMAFSTMVNQVIGASHA